MLEAFDKTGDTARDLVRDHAGVRRPIWIAEVERRAVVNTIVGHKDFGESIFPEAISNRRRVDGLPSWSGTIVETKPK